MPTIALYAEVVEKNLARSAGDVYLPSQALPLGTSTSSPCKKVRKDIGRMGSLAVGSDEQEVRRGCRREHNGAGADLAGRRKR